MLTLRSCLLFTNQNFDFTETTLCIVTSCKSSDKADSAVMLVENLQRFLISFFC